MNPIAIFRHSPTEGPGHLATFLDRRALPWQLVRIDAAEPVPRALEPFSGLVFMGGPMSVNDELPWIGQVLELIRGAVARGMPVLGHCLGGQLMSKALGGAVSRAPVREIGWGEVRVVADEAAYAWFGPACEQFLTFHWHGETFTIPAGAARLLSSRWCDNQAFALGPHLAFQCHIEMTAELVRSWCEGGRAEIEHSRSPGVQPVSDILQDLDARVARLHAVADRVYARWVEGLR